MLLSLPCCCHYHVVVTTLLLSLSCCCHYLVVVADGDSRRGESGLLHHGDAGVGWIGEIRLDAGGQDTDEESQHHQ